MRLTLTKVKTGVGQLTEGMCDMPRPITFDCKYQSIGRGVCAVCSAAAGRPVSRLCEWVDRPGGGTSAGPYYTEEHRGGMSGNSLSRRRAGDFVCGVGLPSVTAPADIFSLCHKWLSLGAGET